MPKLASDKNWVFQGSNPDPGQAQTQSLDSLLSTRKEVEIMVGTAGFLTCSP